MEIARFTYGARILSLTMEGTPDARVYLLESISEAGNQDLARCETSDNFLTIPMVIEVMLNNQFSA